MLKPLRFAVIGAGMAGLSCADSLKAAGHTVSLFDKGRGPGGRMSTRRMGTVLGEVSFDHGAQYLTARDPHFKAVVADWNKQGLVRPWTFAGNDAWVGVPGMSAIMRHMAKAHSVEWELLVTGLVRKGTSWWLTSRNGLTGPFDAVLLAIPAEQAAAMLSLHDFAMGRSALIARSQPCWTGMFAFAKPLDNLPNVLRGSGNLAWAARNSAKPGRSGPEAWVLQMSAAWSSEWLEAEAEKVTGLLLSALEQAAGAPLPAPIAAAAHRWRFALSAGTGEGALWNREIGLGACGDWLLGPRIECAWLSGRMLAEHCQADAQPDVKGREMQFMPTPTGNSFPKGQVTFVEKSRITLL